MVMQLEIIVENGNEYVVEECTQCGKDLKIERQFHEDVESQIKYIRDNAGNGLDNWEGMRRLEGDQDGFLLSSCGNYFCGRKCNAKYND